MAESCCLVGATLSVHVLQERSLKPTQRPVNRFFLCSELLLEIQNVFERASPARDTLLGLSLSLDFLVSAHRLQFRISSRAGVVLSSRWRKRQL